MTTGKSGPEPDRDDQGVYGISVAAELAGTGVQNLRLYERKGLLRPARSAGGTRLYSANDVLRLRRIIDLLTAGLNLTGIAMVLDLQDDNTRMSTQLHRQTKRQPARPADESTLGERPTPTPGRRSRPPS